MRERSSTTATWLALGATAAVLSGGLAQADAAQERQRAGDDDSPTLRLDVKPRSAPVDRRTTFVFRVARSNGRAVAGATVRFAGREARSGRKGGARIVTTLHRSGRFTARATKEGYEQARTGVTARPVGSHPPPERPIAFDGSCEATGTVSFDPPLTNTARPVAQRVQASGKCSGTLTDGRGASHELKNASAIYRAYAPAQEASCGSGTPTGTGALVFRWGTLDFSFSETRVGSTPILSARGANGGSALVTGAPAPSENPATLLQECAGAGIERVTLTGHLMTTPTISG